MSSLFFQEKRRFGNSKTLITKKLHPGAVDKRANGARADDSDKATSIAGAFKRPTSCDIDDSPAGKPFKPPVSLDSLPVSDSDEDRGGFKLQPSYDSDSDQDEVIDGGRADIPKSNYAQVNGSKPNMSTGHGKGEQHNQITVETYDNWSSSPRKIEVHASTQDSEPTSSKLGSHFGSEWSQSSSQKTRRKIGYGKGEISSRRPVKRSADADIEQSSEDESKVERFRSSKVSKITQPKKMKVERIDEVEAARSGFKAPLVLEESFEEEAKPFAPPAHLSSSPNSAGCVFQQTDDKIHVISNSQGFGNSSFEQVASTQRPGFKTLDDSPSSNYSLALQHPDGLVLLPSQDFRSYSGGDSPISSADTDADPETWDDRPSGKTTHCPLCGEIVTRTLLDGYSSGRRMNMSRQAAFCMHHKRQSASEAYDTAGYPNIDWAGLDGRVRKHYKYIESILDGERESYYRNMVSETAKLGKSSRTLLQEMYNPKDTATAGASQGLIPGYYGSRGLRAISENLMARFSPRLRRLAVGDKLIRAAGGVSGYVQKVLVPETTVRLISDDLSIDVEQARKVLSESVALGEVVNEEVAEVVTRLDMSDNDQT